MKNNIRLSASFSEPNGFIFQQNDVLYRQINQSYASEYSLLMESGLYAKLTKAGLLIPDEETKISPVEPAQAFKVIQPEYVPFISYPYEWSFGLLKEAALATLSIQKRRSRRG